MKTKPDLSFWKLWNLSFGFFGVQIAYALQSLTSEPHFLNYRGRSSRPQFLLDSAPIDGHDCAASRRLGE